MQIIWIKSFHVTVVQIPSSLKTTLYFGFLHTFSCITWQQTQKIIMESMQYHFVSIYIMNSLVLLLVHRKYTSKLQILWCTLSYTDTHVVRVVLCLHIWYLYIFLFYCKVPAAMTNCHFYRYCWPAICCAWGNDSIMYLKRIEFSISISLSLPFWGVGGGVQGCKLFLFLDWHHLFS